ncbi:hypothetical protein RJ640_011989 [Escallonia rubra]|uniref:CCHC-type domain-containing protein n=1 Tax=Escallonia rubra TaxID=112253 RepID=A0AA88UKR7_9ASTE|nr:hypothetical protein RJ640_011989 [Escallonia rubra]
MEEDLLFNFVDGLQSWAKKELQRRGVKDVDEAIAMAESLTEYDRGGESSKPKWEDEASEGDHANGGGESPKAWHKGDKHASTSKSEGRGKLEEKRVKNKPKDGCFFCGGPHWAKDCRRQGKLAALVKEKDEEKAERESVRIGSIQVLNALQRKNVPQVPTGKGQASKSEGLLYMEAKLNGKLAHVLVDTGATHNFITMGEAERLGLNVVDGGGWLKPVNAEAKPLQGMVRRVEICLGKWKGFVNFSVARMDDFKVVLGLDFLRQVNALVSPYNNAMCIMERGAACVVPLFGGTSSTMTSMRLSGMRLAQEVEREEAKKSEGTYLASLKVEDRVVLHEFEKRQPPRRKVGDQGKLDRGAKPQNVVPCGMAPPKEEKLSTTSKAKGEIIKLIKEGLQRDPLAKELLQLVKSGKTQRYRVKGDLLYTKDGRVYVPKWRDLRKMVIRGSHDTQSTVHPGHRRTYALVTTAYFWPQMKKEVQMCVKTCHVCRQVKGKSQAEEAKLLDASQVLHDLQRREAEYVLGDRLEQGRDVPPKQHYLVKILNHKDMLHAPDFRKSLVSGYISSQQGKIQANLRESDQVVLSNTDMFVEIFTHIPVIRILPSSDLSAFSTLSTPMEELINKTSSLLVADLDDLLVDETSVLKEYELTLLAKIISSKQPNPKVVQAILQKAWNPLKGMKLQSLQNNIFSITFTHEWDRNRILASRPWSVLNAHVVVRDWPPHLNLEEIDFSKSSFWIRVTGLPPNLMSRQNAERIGAKIGRVMEVDFIADGNVAWLRFLRIQVQIDINNPLHTSFYRIKEPNNEVWTRVQYERLPDFCFSCGRLGHTNRGCPHPPTEPPDNLSSPYGPWLRAESLDSCPRSAFWNPIAVKNRANLPDPTSGTSNLPEKSSSDLPDPTLSDNSSLDQPDPSLPDFLGANLGILPPPKALTLAHSDQSFDKTRHQSSEKRDKASNQSPPFFPQFKALNNTETIPKAGTIPHQPGSPPPTKSAPNPHQLILSPNTQQKRKCKFTLELQTKKPKFDQNSKSFDQTPPFSETLHTTLVDKTKPTAPNRSAKLKALKQLARRTKKPFHLDPISQTPSPPSILIELNSPGVNRAPERSVSYTNGTYTLLHAHTGVFFLPKPHGIPRQWPRRERPRRSAAPSSSSSHMAASTQSFSRSRFYRGSHVSSESSYGSVQLTLKIRDFASGSHERVVQPGQELITTGTRLNIAFREYLDKMFDLILLSSSLVFARSKHTFPSVLQKGFTLDNFSNTLMLLEEIAGASKLSTNFGKASMELPLSPTEKQNQEDISWSNSNHHALKRPSVPIEPYTP